MSTCRSDAEEQQSFQPGWINETTHQYSSTISQSFLYQTNQQLHRFVSLGGDHGKYTDGGGYVYEFRGRLSDLRSNSTQLHRLGWIDQQTRALFIEFSLYNPNVHLLTSLTFLTEFLSTGGLHSQSYIQPMTIDGR